jgi:hypothetical protein
MPVSSPLPPPGWWQVPDGVVILAFLIAFGFIHILLVATVAQLLRKRRFRYLLVGLAAYAWALASWSHAAGGVAPVRGALGGPGTFFALDLLPQLIFAGLTLVVVVAAWRRVQAARPTPRPTAQADAEAWLR